MDEDQIHSACRNVVHGILDALIDNSMTAPVRVPATIARSALEFVLIKEATFRPRFAVFAKSGLARDDLDRMPSVNTERERVSARSRTPSAKKKVDAALAGLDQGELVTIPPLQDGNDWTSWEANRRALAPKFSNAKPAPRYAINRH